MKTKFLNRYNELGCKPRERERRRRRRRKETEKGELSGKFFCWEVFNFFLPPFASPPFESSKLSLLIFKGNVFNLFGSRSKKESEFRFLLKHKRSNVRRNNKKQMSRKHVNDCGRMSTQQHSCRSTNFLTEKHILQLVGTTATCRDQPSQYNFWINAFQKLLYQLSRGYIFRFSTREKLSYDFFWLVRFMTFHAIIFVMCWNF